MFCVLRGTHQDGVAVRVTVAAGHPAAAVACQLFAVGGPYGGAAVRLIGEHPNGMPPPSATRIDCESGKAKRRECVNDIHLRLN